MIDREERAFGGVHCPLFPFALMDAEMAEKFRGRERARKKVRNKRRTNVKQILVVEDDPVIGRTLTMSLPYRGYQVHVAGTIREGRRQFESGSFDLVLLDVQLPDGTGFDLCQGIRARDEWIPILMVTARTDEPSAVMALSIGADDYIRKPFGLDELTARMDRLTNRKSGRKDLLHYRSIQIDRSKRMVWVEEKEVPLGKREFEILSILVRRGGEVVTREEILDALSDQADMFDRTIDSHLSHLRKKIREIAGSTIQIVPVYGVGYRLEAQKGPS